MVHGDGFIAVGPHQHLKETKRTLEEKYKLKTQELGCGEGQKEEIRILNKVVRMTSDGIELEADPRHAELVIKDLGLEGSKPSTVPGAKDDGSKNKNKVIIENGYDIDSVQNAKTSAGNED